jgi:hypothetical protein
MMHNCNEHREEEAEIICRDLSLLSGLDPVDREIIKRVHGIHPYSEKQDILPAVRSCLNGKTANTYVYYYALGRLIKIQAKQPGSERWLSEKYRRTEQAEEELLCMDRRGASRTAMYRKWDLLFAQYYYNLDRKQGGAKKNTKYSAFKDGLRLFLEGMVRFIDLKELYSGIYASIEREIGLSNYRLLTELYIDYWLHGMLPSEEETRKKKIPRGNLEKIVSELGGYEKIREYWLKVFQEIKPSDYGIAVMHALRSKINPDIISMAKSRMALDSIRRIYSAHPDKKRQLDLIFNRINPGRFQEICNILTNPGYMMPKTSGITPDFDDAVEYCIRQAEPRVCRRFRR